MYPYPKVKNEYDTIRAVATGKNLARFGDGELKLIRGGSALREPKNERLGRELLQVLRNPHPNCLIGIPTLDETGPKIKGWLRHAADFCQVLLDDKEYYSAFVSRPDSAPAINTVEYAQMVVDLWKGKRVTVVCEPTGFMLRTVQRTEAVSITHIECPRYEAYADMGRIEKHVVRSEPEFVIMAAGPTATCLANRLATHGIHALDLGSAGRFLYRMLWPEEYGQFATDNEKKKAADQPE